MRRASIFAVTLAGLTLPTIAAAEPRVVSGEVFVKLPGATSAGGGQIEIESWSWGAARSSADLGSWSKAEGLEVGQDGARRDMVMKGSNIGQNSTSSGVGGSETITTHGNRTEAGQATGKRQHMPMRTRSYYDQAQPRDAASGLATGKRQHKPMTLSKPLNKGSVWIRVASPWAACRVGARYPSIELSSGTETYLLQDVTVANCGSQQNAPTEEVAFYYNRIAFDYAQTRDRP